VRAVWLWATELEMFQKSISILFLFLSIIIFLVLFEKFPKLLGRSRGVGSDGLVARPSNLKCFKENLNF
jgi:hypothetical protein